MLSADVEIQAGAFRSRAILEVAAGKTLVLFGPSGAGKSLLLRGLAGIHHPARGRITLDGRALLDSARGIDVPPQARQLGYVPQSYALFPHLNVAENVGFGVRGLRAAERRARVEALLATLQLDGLAARRPAQLSGGQQQRVALARALMVEPCVLLLDEPFAALDAPLRRLLRRELQTLRHRFRFAMVLVTHDLGDACALGDTIAVMDGGQVIQTGTPPEILARPATPMVARLTGVRNVFPARVIAAHDGALEVSAARFTVLTPPYPFAPGTLVDLYVRPEYVTLIRPEHEHEPLRGNVVRGEIVDELHLGPVHTLYFRLSDGPDHALGAPYDLEVDVAAHPYQALRVAQRRTWMLLLGPEALHLTAAGDREAAAAVRWPTAVAEAE